MISLHLTLWPSEQGDRFTVHAADDMDPNNLCDVTAQYDLTAIATEDGRSGFAIIKRDEPARNPTGAEL